MIANMEPADQITARQTARYLMTPRPHGLSCRIDYRNPEIRLPNVQQRKRVQPEEEVSCGLEKMGSKRLPAFNQRTFGVSNMVTHVFPALHTETSICLLDIEC